MSVCRRGIGRDIMPSMDLVGSVADLIKQQVSIREKWLAEQVERLGIDVTERRRCGKCGHDVAGWYGGEPGQHVILEERPMQFSTTDEPDRIVMRATQDVRLAHCEHRPLD